MTERFVDVLQGGRPNSLGRTEEVVTLVLADRARLDELFDALACLDELVRLRVGDALEKVCREQPGWFRPRIERLLTDVGAMTQPSVQWHVAQMLDHLRGDLSGEQAARATALLQQNLVTSGDWIVLNVTMDVLTRWSAQDPMLAAWLRPELERLTGDPRKSVAARARKRLGEVYVTDRGRRSRGNG